MKIAIVGGGASGLTCAISAALKAKENKNPQDITVFESRDKVGRKLLATGNGRCNLMNRNEGDFYFDEIGFSSYALKSFDLESNLDFFARLGLYTRSDDEGRIYPLSNQASSVLDALRFACVRLGVRIICDSEISKIKKTSAGFTLDDKGNFDCVVLACGGKASVKKFNGYDLLKQLGHRVTPVMPSLTKLEVKDKKFVKQLKGVRQKGSFSLFNGDRFLSEETGEILFTDYGLSGIAVMQLSAYVARLENCNNVKIRANFVPEFSFNELYEAMRRFAHENPDETVSNLLTGFVAKKLGEMILKSLAVDLAWSFSRLDDKKLKEIASALKKFSFDITALCGFEDAQVTAGGADCREFNPKTMESKKVKGLYCIGELLDVDGLCGGYNLHWAWSSGRLCGESIADKYNQNREG